MKYHSALITLVLTLFFITGWADAALDTADIDKVIKKEVLDQQDLEIINKYVAAAVSQMLNTKDFGNIGNVRNEILARAHSTQSSADIQYNPQFITAAAQNLEKAFDQAKKISDPDLRSAVTLNVMILLDNLNSPKLAELALKMTDNENVSVRYWAVHAVTNNSFTEQFNSGKASADIARTVAARLKDRIDAETSPYIISQIAQFGAASSIPQAHELLYQIADNRLKKYQTWTIEDFSLDGTVLKLLADKITGPDKAVAGWRFGQLYSYAIEFYVKSKGILDNSQRDQLAAVLIQTEGDSLTKLGMPQSGIRKALEKKDDKALLTEHKDLFGDAAAAGKFTTTLGLTYPGPDGAKRQTPLPLPEKPKTAS